MLFKVALTVHEIINRHNYSVGCEISLYTMIKNLKRNLYLQEQINLYVLKWVQPIKKEGSRFHLSDVCD